MDMVGHQAVRIDCTTRGQRPPELIVRLNHVLEDKHELTIVIIVFENRLTIDTAEHHMMDAS
jgi:hypothetical protein